MGYFYNVIIAVITNLLFLPFWYFEDAIWVPAIQAVVNGILLPVSLAALNLILIFKKQIKFPTILYFIIPLACLIGGICMYLDWGISTGNLFRPDEETVLLITFLSVTSIGLSLVLLGISHAVLKICQSRRENVLNTGKGKRAGC